MFLGSGLLFLAMIFAAAARPPPSFLTYVVALVLLVIMAQAPWGILVFRGWAFLVSVYVLVTHLAGGSAGRVGRRAVATE